MSTTFGIIIKSEVIEIARRVTGAIWFTNPLASLLPNDTKVEPLDNSAQGVYNIGDIKKLINEGD